MLALDGRCKTLDSAADGYVQAENCIMLLLEEADNALKQCAAIIGGTAVNQACLSYINLNIYTIQIIDSSD